MVIEAKRSQNLQAGDLGELVVKFLFKSEDLKARGSDGVNPSPRLGEDGVRGPSSVVRGKKIRATSSFHVFLYSGFGGNLLY